MSILRVSYNNIFRRLILRVSYNNIFRKLVGVTKASDNLVFADYDVDCPKVRVRKSSYNLQQRSENLDSL